MLNFTVGPVSMTPQIRALGSEAIPYFRTEEFSGLMLENEKLILKLTYAPMGSRAVFITGSGTAAMEASIMHALTPEDKVLIINGGSFGYRFVELCALHQIPYVELLPIPGESVTAEQLVPFDGQGFTALLVNIHETSTGVLYDIDILSNFCKRNNLLLIVDAISSFLADPFNMSENCADVVIIGSQKALACPPGISILVLSPRALNRINDNPIKSYYLNLKSALCNQERGQTPFTPAVGILRQLNARLCGIDAIGGADVICKQTASIANDFRNKIKSLPFRITSNSLSNAVTPLHPLHGSAYDLFLILKNQYRIWVCPNGGSLREQVFRVGHLGALTVSDNDELVTALSQCCL